ncbi:MAG: hypothetical protein R3E12_05820 [Candidatus Eisenbacteria bacterium]
MTGFFRLEIGQQELSGRDVGSRQADPTVAFVERDCEVVGARLELGVPDRRARRQDLDDLSFEQLFPGTRLLDLFADRQLVTRLEELGDVPFSGVPGTRRAGWAPDRPRCGWSK